MSFINKIKGWFASDDALLKQNGFGQPAWQIGNYSGIVICRAISAGFKPHRGAMSNEAGAEEA